MLITYLDNLSILSKYSYSLHNIKLTNKNFFVHNLKKYFFLKFQIFSVFDNSQNVKIFVDNFLFSTVKKTLYFSSLSDLLTKFIHTFKLLSTHFVNNNSLEKNKKIKITFTLCKLIFEISLPSCYTPKNYYCM